MEGWVTLQRKFINWEWFDKPEMVQLFIYLLLSANYAETKWRGRTIKRGQVMTSLRKLSFATGLSERSVRTCLNRLKSTCEVTCEATNEYTIVTICNYDKYQDDVSRVDKQNDTRADKRATNERQATDTPLYIKQYNKKNNITISLSDEAREREEIFKIFFLKNFETPKAEVDRFFDCYEAQGWVRSNGQKITDKIAAAKMWDQAKGKGAGYPKPFIDAMLRVNDVLLQTEGGWQIMQDIIRGIERVEMDSCNTIIFCENEHIAESIEHNCCDIIRQVTRRNLHYGIKKTT